MLAHALFLRIIILGGGKLDCHNALHAPYHHPASSVDAVPRHTLFFLEESRYLICLVGI